MAHPNEEALRTGYDAFAKGDMDTVMGLFADDILWHVPGRNELAGDYRGQQEVMGFFGKLMEGTDGTFRVVVHDVLANEEHAIGLVRLQADRKGRSIDAKDVHVWHAKDGKFSEFWSNFFDQYEWDDFWS